MKIHNRLVSLFDDMVRASVSADELARLRQAGAADVAHALSQVGLHGQSTRVVVRPREFNVQPWHTVVFGEVYDIRDRVGRFMGRYVSLAEPDLLEALQRLEETALFGLLDHREFMENLGSIDAAIWSEAIGEGEALHQAIVRSLDAHGLEGREGFQLVGFGLVPQPKHIRLLGDRAGRSA